MVALSVGKKRELGTFLSMLAKTIGGVGLVVILMSCGGTSPGYTYTVGGTVSGLAGSGLVLQINGGDDKSISANGYFTFATPLTDGAPYNITVKSPGPVNPTQTCRVISNGTGIINSAPVVNVVVSCMTSPTAIAFSVESGNEFAYVSNDINTILTYLIDLLNGGKFTYKGTADTGDYPTSIAVDHSGHFAYVANTNDGTISTYTIDSSSGVLNSTCGISPFCPSTGNYPTAITLDPLEQFVYVANMGDNTISAYSIGSGGALTLIGTYSTGTNPVSIVTVSVGSSKFAYVANMGNNTISAYSIGSGGALTAIGSLVSTGTSPVSITVDPLGQFAYVANEGSNSISIYTINTTDGTLAASTVMPTRTVGTNPTSVVTVLVGSSKFAYVTNTSDSTISAYSIGSGGALTLIGTVSTATGTYYPTAITIDPSGQFAYVVNSGDGSIWAYPINQSTGALGTPSGPL
jgi:6-phosphogluconolactonase